MADQAGEIAKPLRFDLIGEGNIVDLFFDFIDILLLPGIEQMKTLVKKDPENTAAQFSGFVVVTGCLTVQGVGLGRVRLQVVFTDGKAPTDVLPFVVI